MAALHAFRGAFPDPKLADAVFTDHLGDAFEKQLIDLRDQLNNVAGLPSTAQVATISNQMAALDTANNQILQTTGQQSAPSPAYVFTFLATADGLALVKAFMALKDAKVRRSIVDHLRSIKHVLKELN